MSFDSSVHSRNHQYNLDTKHFIMIKRVLMSLCRPSLPPLLAPLLSATINCFLYIYKFIQYVFFYG